MIGIGSNIAKRNYPGTSGAIVYDVDAQAYFDRLPDGLSAEQKGYISAWIAGIKADNSLTNLSDAFDCLYLLGGVTTEANAKINLISASFPIVTVNSPTWASTGYTGDGLTSYLKLSYTPSSDAIVLVLDDALLISYQRLNIGSAYSIGALDLAGNRFQQLPMFTDGNSYSAIESSGFGTAANSSPQGLTLCNRVNNTQHKIYQEGVLLQTFSLASSGLPSVEIYGLGNNFNDTLQLPTVNEISLLGAGKGTKIAQASFHTRTDLLATQLGFHF